MLEMANINDILIKDVAAIAESMCGVDHDYAGGMDVLHRSVHRIAENVKDNPVATSAVNLDPCSADSVAGVVSYINDMVSKMKDSGVIAPDEFTMAFATVTDSVSGRADRQYNTDKISSVAEDDGVITITLSAKVSALKDFEAGNGWGNHKWLGIGIGVGINPITGLKYNGNSLTADDVTEATQVGLSAGYFVRWVAADLVLANDNSQKSKNYFTLKAAGYANTDYTLKIVEPA